MVAESGERWGPLGAQDVAESFDLPSAELALGGHSTHHATDHLTIQEKVVAARGRGAVGHRASRVKSLDTFDDRAERGRRLRRAHSTSILVRLQRAKRSQDVVCTFSAEQAANDLSCRRHAVSAVIFETLRQDRHRYFPRARIRRRAAAGSRRGQAYICRPRWS